MATIRLSEKVSWRPMAVPNVCRHPLVAVERLVLGRRLVLKEPTKFHRLAGSNRGPVPRHGVGSAVTLTPLLGAGAVKGGVRPRIPVRIAVVRGGVLRPFLRVGAHKLPLTSFNLKTTFTAHSVFGVKWMSINTAVGRAHHRFS